MYYVVSIQIMKDDTQAQSIFAYEDLRQAKSAYFSIMSSNEISTTINTCSCFVCNQIGGIIETKYEIFGKDPEPTPEIEANEES